MNLLALDVGTSSAKAAVLDAVTGQPRGKAACASITLDAPAPDAAEIPSRRLWDAVAAAARQAVRQSGVAGQAGQDIAAIGLTTFGPALVLLGKDDQPLGPIWTHLDRRARSVARQVWAHVGEDFLATIGNRPLPGVISALSWHQQLFADPYLSHRVHTYLHLNGWLAFHLTGAKAFDPCNACFSGLYETVASQSWSSRWCEYFEVDRSWLPPVVNGDTTVGALRPAVAGELGVPAGLPVKLGTSDISSALLAAQMNADDLLHVEGATQMLAVVTERLLPARTRLSCALGVGSQSVRIAHNPVGSRAVEWVRNLCFRDQSEQEFYDRTIALARERTSRVSLDPPFLAGGALEIETHRAAFRELDLTIDRLDLLAALLDAVVRRHREAVANLGQGTQFRRVIFTGDGLELMRQLVPEYHQAPMQALQEGPLRGVARLFEDK
jgi:xylulokinase